MAVGRARRFFRGIGSRLSIKAGDAFARLVLSRKLVVKHGGFRYNVYYHSSSDGVCYVHRFSQAFFSSQRRGIPKTEEVRKILSLIEAQARKKGFKALSLNVVSPLDKAIERANAGYYPEEDNYTGMFAYWKKL